VNRRIEADVVLESSEIHQNTVQSERRDLIAGRFLRAAEAMLTRARRLLLRRFQTPSDFVATFPWLPFPVCVDEQIQLRRKE
jgi:hypothetical protein